MRCPAFGSHCHRNIIHIPFKTILAFAEGDIRAGRGVGEILGLLFKVIISRTIGSPIVIAVGVNSHKGAGVAQITHITHRKSVIPLTAGLIRQQPERDFEGVGRLLETRHREIIARAVVQFQPIISAGSVVVATSRKVTVNIIPAIERLFTLHVVFVGKCGIKAAIRLERERGRWEQGSVTHRHDIAFVRGYGSQSCQRIGVGGEVLHFRVGGLCALLVVEIPRGSAWTG